MVSKNFSLAKVITFLKTITKNFRQPNVVCHVPKCSLTLSRLRQKGHQYQTRSLNSELLNRYKVILCNEPPSILYRVITLLVYTDKIMPIEDFGFVCFKAIPHCLVLKPISEARRRGLRTIHRLVIIRFVYNCQSITNESCSSSKCPVPSEETSFEFLPTEAILWPCGMLDGQAKSKSCQRRHGMLLCASHFSQSLCKVFNILKCVFCNSM